MDDGWTPWPPRPYWTAYEITAEWDSADDPLTFLASLSEREWALINEAAADAPDANGERPSLHTRDTAQELLASVGGRAS